MTSPAPRRIRVVGNSGAGKTTVARTVARRLGLAHLELDGIYHLEGWQPAPRADFQASLERFLAAQGAGGWVIDGNYDTSVGDALDHADLVVWLDYPRPLVMARVIRRTLGRVALRRPLWNGNRERWGSLVKRRPEDNIIVWAWTQDAAYRARYEERFAAAEPGTWLRLRSPGATRRWVRSI